MSARAAQIEDAKTSDIDRENFAVKITDSCDTHQEWLPLVRYGLTTLLQNPPLLMEIIVREAVREIERERIPGHVVADEARRIFQELGLRFEVQ